MYSVLITGVAGSGGSYLADHIAQCQPYVEVHGISRRRVDSRARVHQADLTDLGSVMRVLRQVEPDAIFHLAAYADVRSSFSMPGAIISSNVLGTSNLLEAVRLLGQDPVIQLCSSSEVYGQVGPEMVPIKEDAPLRPASPYAVSKVAQDLLGWTYFTAYGMRIIRTRMFTYINPRRADLFATSFARQIAQVEHGVADEVVHGNLGSVRTLLDVRDAVRAYWYAIRYCQPGEAYNIGGDTVMTVGQVLEKLISMGTVPVATRLDPGLLRPADVTRQIPCVNKFVAETGWRPAYSVEESLEGLLNYWRQRVRR